MDNEHIVKHLQIPQNRILRLELLVTGGVDAGEDKKLREEIRAEIAKLRLKEIEKGGENCEPKVVDGEKLLSDSCKSLKESLEAWREIFQAESPLKGDSVKHRVTGAVGIVEVVACPPKNMHVEVRITPQSYTEDWHINNLELLPCDPPTDRDGKVLKVGDRVRCNACNVACNKIIKNIHSANTITLHFCDHRIDPSDVELLPGDDPPTDKNGKPLKVGGHYSLTRIGILESFTEDGDTQLIEYWDGESIGTINCCPSELELLPDDKPTDKNGKPLIPGKSKVRWTNEYNDSWTGLFVGVVRGVYTDFYVIKWDDGSEDGYVNRKDVELLPEAEPSFSCPKCGRSAIKCKCGCGRWYCKCGYNWYGGEPVGSEPEPKPAPTLTEGTGICGVRPDRGIKRNCVHCGEIITYFDCSPDVTKNCPSCGKAYWNVEVHLPGPEPASELPTPGTFPQTATTEPITIYSGSGGGCSDGGVRPPTSGTQPAPVAEDESTSKLLEHINSIGRKSTPKVEQPVAKDRNETELREEDVVKDPTTMREGTIESISEDGMQGYISYNMPMSEGDYWMFDQLVLWRRKDTAQQPVTMYTTSEIIQAFLETDYPVVDHASRGLALVSKLEANRKDGAK